MKKLFLAITAWFTWLNWYPGFKDSDGFYHAKLVELMRDTGIVYDFPWLPLTVLSDNFANHHALYHALIIPFATLTSALIASKIVSVALGILSLYILYRLLRAFNAPIPGFFVALLAIAPYFALRATMVKASGAALCVQLLLLAALLFKKPLAAFALSAIYVYTHGGFPFALIMLACVAFAELFTRSAEGQGTRSEFRTNVINVIRENAALFAAVPLGLLAGLVINPYFPSNLYFYWHQIVQVAVVGTPRTLMVGAEWYPVNIQELFAVSWPLMLALFIPIIFAFRNRRVPQYSHVAAVRLVTLFLLTAATFLLTLRSNRHAEYFLPYFALLVGYIWSLLAPEWDAKHIYARIAEYRAKHPIRLAATACGLTALIAGSATMTIVMLRTHILPWNAAKATANCVQTHAKPGELVFDGSWDFFPELWYWNSQNHYINGLDTRFLYAKNPELALAYQELEQHPKSTKNMSVEQIIDMFPVNIVVLPVTPLRLTAIQELKQMPHKFAVLCEDSSAIVFQKRADK